MALSKDDRMNKAESVAIHERVYRQLRRRLMSGQFMPGQPISIRYLTDALGVSATPVREALKRLEAESALVKGRNRTLTVPVLSRAGLRDMRDIRILLEGLAAERATARITPDEIDVATAACQDMADAAEAGNIDLYLSANWDFHRTIYVAAQMETLVNMVEGLWMRIGPLIRLAVPMENHIEHSMLCHWRAVDALRQRDGEAARAAIVSDIAGAAADLEALLPK